MKTISRICALVLLVIAVTSCAQSQQTPSTKEQELTARAHTLLKLLQAGEYEKCIPLFDSSVLIMLNKDRLKAGWEAAEVQLGKLVKQTGDTFEDNADHPVVYLGCEFEHAQVDLKVLFNQHGKVLSFFTAPPHNDHYSLPSYAHPDSVIEREVAVVTDSFNLGATLTIPKNAAHPPIVVYVQGSGNNDRDETIKSNKDFKDIAYALANFGIASLRYDKRTFVYGAHHSSRSYLDLTPKEEVTDDAQSALKLARTFPEVDTSKIFLLGHSLGAMMAPRIAQLDGRLAGVIMMAAPARPFEDIVLEQEEYLLPQQASKEQSEKGIKATREFVERIKKHQYSDSTSPELLFNLPGKYWDYLRLYDQVKTAEILTVPMLLLQGDKDYQVSPKEYELWKKALGGNKKVTFMMFPGLYHLFMRGKGTYTDYNVPSHVSEEVTTTIAKWILQH